MSPEDEKRLGWWALAAYLLACILAGLIGSICRADSTFVPIEPPKPTVDTVRLVCKSCGHCIPRDLGGGITLLGCLADPCCNTVHERYECQQTGVQFEEKYADCSVIVWGRWRQICRVDTAFKYSYRDSVSEYPHYNRDSSAYSPVCTVWNVKKKIIEHIDTIYTDDPRCLKIQSFRGIDTRGIMQDEAMAYKGIVRARGLDSVYVLPHDSLVAGSGLVTSHTIQIPGHWEYFNWLNGKRVNMRRSK